MSISKFVSSKARNYRPALWLALFVALAGSAVGQPFHSSAWPDRITLTWAADPAHSQTVTWRTDSTVVQAVAQLKVEDGTPDMQAGMQEYRAASRVLVTKEGRTDRYHHVSFGGLQPGTRYTYRVGDGEHWSEWFQFRTAAAQTSDSAFSFIYLGDGQNDLKSRWSRTVRAAILADPDARFVIHAGDLINRANTDKEWGEWHHGGGFFNAMVPVVPTPGNHEYFRDTAERLTLDPHWAAQFTLPRNGPEGLQESVYYLDYQYVRIISLNSQLIMLDEEARNAQLRWLEGVLANNPKLWTIVTMHHPVYSTSKRRDNAVLRELFKPVFDRYGVDLVFQGHDHTYARGRGAGAQPTSPMYVVSVAGPKMYDSDSDRWMDKALTETQVYQLIQLDGNRLEYEAYNVAGLLVDQFVLEKD